MMLRTDSSKGALYMPTVAVIDDHPVLRLGIVEALKAYPDIKIIGEAGSGPELDVLLKKGAPDVLLLDISMPEFDISEAVPQLQKLYPQMRIIIVTIHRDEKNVCDLVRLGVDGYLIKEEPSPVYARAIRIVAGGKTYFSQEVIPIMSGMNSSPDIPHLTKRELEVLEVIATGATTAEIAAELYVTERTVSTHISNIYRKLEVNTRVAAVRKAEELNLLTGQRSR